MSFYSKAQQIRHMFFFIRNAQGHVNGLIFESIKQVTKKIVFDEDSKENICYINILY